MGGAPFGMSWFLEALVEGGTQISHALDSADYALADVSSSQGYLPASHSDVGASLVPTAARDKVLRRIEAQRSPTHLDAACTPPGSPRAIPSWAVPSPSKDMSYELEQLSAALSEKTREADENLAGMIEAEQARKESEQVAMELQAKAVVFMDRCNSLTAQNAQQEAASHNPNHQVIEGDCSSFTAIHKLAGDLQPPSPITALADTQEQLARLETAVEAERMTSAELREGLSVQENAFEHQLSQLRIQLRDKSIELHHQTAASIDFGGGGCMIQQELDGEMGRAAELELELSLSRARADELETQLQSALQDNLKMMQQLHPSK